MFVDTVIGMSADLPAHSNEAGAWPSLGIATSFFLSENLSTLVMTPC